MKVDYKGYEIEVTRDKCLGGWTQTYYNIYRKSDGLCVMDSFSQSEETINEYVTWLKDEVDQFINTKGGSQDLEDWYLTTPQDTEAGDE